MYFRSSVQWDLNFFLYFCFHKENKLSYYIFKESFPDFPPKLFSTLDGNVCHRNLKKKEIKFIINYK